MRRVDELRQTGLARCKYHGHHGDWRIYAYKHSTKIVANCVPCGRSSCNRARLKKSNLDRMWANIKKSAKEKPFEFTLTRTEFISWYQAQPLRCAITQRSFTKAFLPSIDRIDNKQGYSLENMHIIGLPINQMKRAFSLTDLRKYASWILSPLAESP